MKNSIKNFKKVTVSGWVNEEFTGTDDQVNQYLIGLKRRQELNVSESDLKFYKKDAKTAKPVVNYKLYEKSYTNPSCQREKFREKYAEFGLKIKIEPVTEITSTESYF